jgi:hypothetical protein
MDPAGTSATLGSREPAAPAPRKPAARPVPVRTEEHAHLSLEELREYRKVLSAEESRVSYWRRILQARLDLLLAGADADGDTLRPVLTDRRVGAGRRALVEITPVDDIPPLPDLAELWDRVVDLQDAEAVASLTEDLSAAERQLSEYRTALHRRIGAATGELIARYREEPTLCLSALPLQESRRSIPA